MTKKDFVVANALNMALASINTIKVNDIKWMVSVFVRELQKINQQTHQQFDIPNFLQEVFKDSNITQRIANEIIQECTRR